MFKPVEAEVVNRLDSQQGLNFYFDLSREATIAQATPYKFEFCTLEVGICHVRWGKDYIQIEELDLHESQLSEQIALQEVMLTLMIRELIRFTGEQDRSTLYISFDNVLLIDPLLDNGFGVRKANSQERGIYRARYKR